MGEFKTSIYGYLARDAYGNRSPVVQLQCGGELRSDQFKRWSAHELKQYLLYHANDTPIDSLFSSFLFSPNRAKSGRFLNPLFSGFESPTDQSDWLEWRRELLGPDGNLPALQQAVREAQPFCQGADVWVTLPYPETEQARFGVVDGVELDFAKREDRERALRWWIAEFMEEWKSAGLETELRLRGFRWARETILGQDLDVVSTIADVIHQAGCQFLWATNYGANHALDWKQIGFDVVVLHPNYYGNTSYGWDWIDNAAYFAGAYHCGMQIIYGKGLLYDEDHIYDYLNRGLPEFRDYMNQSFVLFTFDNLDIQEVYKSQLSLYIKIYCFVKGIYQKTTYGGIKY